MPATLHAGWELSTVCRILTRSGVGSWGDEVRVRGLLILDGIYRGCQSHEMADLVVLIRQVKGLAVVGWLISAWDWAVVNF